MLFLRIRL